MKKLLPAILILLGVATWSLWPDKPEPVGAPFNLQKLKNDIQTIETDCQGTTGEYCQYTASGTDWKGVANVYDGPKGKGYEIEVRQRVNNTIVQSIFNYGPETERNLTQTVICTDFISSTSTDNICAL